MVAEVVNTSEGFDMIVYVSVFAARMSCSLAQTGVQASYLYVFRSTVSGFSGQASTSILKFGRYQGSLSRPRKPVSDLNRPLASEEGRHADGRTHPRSDGINL